MKWFLVALAGFTLGSLLTSLVFCIFLIFFSAPDGGSASSPRPTPTPDGCFKTANYQNGQIVSYSYKCVPITPMP